MSTTTITSTKQGRIDAQRLREERNKELRAAKQPTPWEEAKAARKAKRVNKPMQKRSPRGFIMGKDKYGAPILIWDTQQAYNDALVRLAQEQDERLAEEFAKEQRRKARASKKPEPKPGKVTTRNTRKGNKKS